MGTRVSVAANALDDSGVPEHYYDEMRDSEEGNAFWRRTTDEKWGYSGVDTAEGDAAQFDKDSFVEALYSKDGFWYTGSIMKYVGDGDWIVLWQDYDMPDGSPKASTVKTKNIRLVSMDDISV